MSSVCSVVQFHISFHDLENVDICVASRGPPGDPVDHSQGSAAIFRQFHDNAL